ncbi:MAG: acetylxylan esterase [Bacteroidota bacterium]
MQPFFDKRTVLIGLIVFFCGIVQLTFAQLSVKADRPTSNYEAGEMMYFEVVADTWGPVDYLIRFDARTPALASGQIIVDPFVPAKIPFVLQEPGSVICRVQKDGANAVGGAVFSMWDMEVYHEEPADFDAFWDGVKAELAAVPIDPVLSFYDSTSLSETFRINLGNIDNRRVYGYLSIPKGIAPPYPAIVTLPPFGSVANIVPPKPLMSEWGGAISLTISIHNAEPDEVDPNSYLPNNIANRDSIYYKQAITGAIRAIDYIFTRPDFNGEEVGVVGLSQGGGLALITAGVDQRVKSLIQTVTVLCGHAGHRYDRPSGLPLYILDSRGFNGTIAHEDSTLAASQYFDGVFFAKRYKGPSLSFVSYADSISPAQTVLTALEQLRDNSIVMHSTRLGHDNPPEFWDMRFEFWRKTFPSMQNNPWIWTPSTTGYDANAGDDMSITSGTIATLTGAVTYNGDPMSNLPVKWMLVEGPGKVSFTHPTGYATDATFSENGEYLLRFVARDAPNLDTEGEFFLISDFVKVTVGN